MNIERRNVLKLGTALAVALTAGVIKPQQAWAAQEKWNEEAFEATDIEGVIEALGGSGSGEESDKISLQAPDIAENGAVVPVAVASELENTTEISILVPENPNALTAQFTIPEGTLPEVATRIKMGGTSDIYALVKADGNYYLAHKEVKVTLGGCGG
ncbi:MAG TPA: thiosulfate oxidation carrier protein SoxY [Burkholderiaceae bacterium]|nr:thiosulfate oxidation carrier protein SoxY [Burkholderiaceae bacterium]